MRDKREVGGIEWIKGGGSRGAGKWKKGNRPEVLYIRVSLEGRMTAGSAGCAVMAICFTAEL